MTRTAIGSSAVLAAALALLPARASGQQGVIEGLRAVVDTNFSAVSTTVTDATGTETTTTSNNWLPRLTLNTEAMLYPNLRLSAGGIFEFNSVSSGTPGTPSTSLTRIRPFFELRSTNPLFSPGIGYYRRVNRASSSGQPSFTVVSEDYAGYLGWRPAALPQFDFQFVRTNLFDADRLDQDTTKDFGSVLSRYAINGLNTYYQGTYLDTNDRLRGVETRQVSNAGRVDYAAAFLRKRLQWNASYSVNHQTLTTMGSGQDGEVAVPVTPFAGVSGLSDTPVTAVLAQNPLLIDGNLTASAGINLGFPAPGTAAPARNVGLDFLSPAEIDRLWIWIDREVPAEIANTFSWEIYSSPDNLVWRRETLVALAPFGPFENRFQADFPAVTARFVKVVVRPLSGTVVDASRYPDIFVTEIQAFLTRPTADSRGTQERTVQSLNTDVRLRLLDTPLLYYEGSYWYNGVEPSSRRRDTLSNGLSVTHRFGRMMSAYGRGAYEQGVQPEGRRVAKVANATLTLDPLSTFTASLLYTGHDERLDDRPNDRQSVIVQTNTQLYRGVDVQFGFGWNFTTRETGEELRDRLLNLSAAVTPREDLVLTVNYVDTDTTLSRESLASGRFHTRRAYVTLVYDPTRTLHFVLAEEVVVTRGERTRTTHNIGANWAPFPDGSLQFIVAYNEALRAIQFGKERNFQSTVRWKFSRQSYLDFSYQRIKGAFLLQTTESRILGINLKLFL